MYAGAMLSFAYGLIAFALPAVMVGLICGIVGKCRKEHQQMHSSGASHEHFITKELYSAEIDALPNVRSLTYRMMTEKEDAAGHCNVCNPKLVLDAVFCGWTD